MRKSNNNNDLKMASMILLGIVMTVSHCTQGLVNPVAFYPLDQKHQATDNSCHDNKDGDIVGAKLTEGPKGTPNGAYDFAATPKNYIEIPGTQYTDTRYSITILVWMYHSGFSGPIVDYATDGLGVNLWMMGKDTLYGGIISRDKRTSHFLSNNQVGLQYSWHYVGLSYDYSSGMTALWVDGIKVKTLYIGSIELKTTGILRLGALSTDDRYFRGKISCLQIYDEALKETSVLEARKRCNYKVLDCSATSTVECGGELSLSSGTITSPRYPREYPPNVDCVWKLTITKGKRIAIRFRNIELERDIYSCGDYIEVFDGLNSWSTRLVKYCKTPEDGAMELVVSKSNTMRIEFKSNSNINGKGFQAYYKTEDIAKAGDEAALDLSVHYTGIVIGVACAALFAALTIIAINHTKQSRRRRSSTLSTTRPRRSESFSATDIIVQGAPPSYDVVMRCPDLYPPSPQMSPATSVVSTPGGVARFGAHQHVPSPLSTRTINSSISQTFNKRHSNGLSEDSDEEDPPPYPGMEMAQRGQSQDLQHNDQSNIANSTCNDSSNQLHQVNNSSSSLSGIDMRSQDSSTRDALDSSPPHNPSTSPSLCLSEIGTNDVDNVNQIDEINTQAETSQSHVQHNILGQNSEMPDSSHEIAADGSNNVSVAVATSDGSDEEQSKTSVLEIDEDNDEIRNRLDSQTSIVGTVV